MTKNMCFPAGTHLSMRNLSGLVSVNMKWGSHITMNHCAVWAAVWTNKWTWWKDVHVAFISIEEPVLKNVWTSFNKVLRFKYFDVESCEKDSAPSSYCMVFMYVCMHVCFHVCMYLCMYICMFWCKYACMCVCLYACMCAFMYVCFHVYMYACVLSSVLSCMYVCILVLCIWQTAARWCGG